MSRAETPLQVADRELAQAKANHKELKRLYQIADVEAHIAMGKKRELEDQYQSIMIKTQRGIRNGTYDEGSILEIGGAIEKAKAVINNFYLAHEAMDRALDIYNIKLAEQRKQHGNAVRAANAANAAERDAWAEGVDSRGRPLPLFSDAEHKARIAAASGAKPSFFGRLGRFFGRSPAPADSRAVSNARRNARVDRYAEYAAVSSAGSPRYNGAPAGPLIRPSAAARAARYAEEPFAGPYSSTRYGGKTKRRHTKRRKSRKSRK